MNSSTTTLPRRLARLIVWPRWSVRVNPGARTPGTGESCIRLARLVEMFPGMPDGRRFAPAIALSWLVSTYAA